MSLHPDYIHTPEQLRAFELSKKFPSIEAIAREMNLTRSAVSNLHRLYIRGEEALEAEAEGVEFYELCYATGATLDRVLVPLYAGHKWGITKDLIRRLISAKTIKLGGGPGALKRVGPKMTAEIMKWIGAEIIQ